MGFSYHELKSIKKNSIVLEKEENIEIQQNCKGFSRKKSTFIRERFFCAPISSCRRRINEQQTKRIKGKISKQNCEIQEPLKDSVLVLEKGLREKFAGKFQNTCYKLANLEEDINHEIKKLQAGNDILLEAFSGMETNFGLKNKNKIDKEEKTWAEHLARNSYSSKDKQQDHFDISKEKFSLQHQCISTSPRYGDDEYLAPRPRMRSVGSQITTTNENLDQGALGDHKKVSNLNIRKENKEHVNTDLQNVQQFNDQNNFTVNCCSGMSQQPYPSYDAYSKVPPNGAGNYYYGCYQPDVVQGVPPNVFCRNEYYYDCGKCGSNPYNRFSNSSAITTPNRRRATDLNTEFFCSRYNEEARIKSAKENNQKNKNNHNERKSREFEKGKNKEPATKQRRNNSKNKTNKGEKLDKLKSEEIVKILRNLDRYVDERDKELKLKRKQIADDYSLPTSTMQARSETKLYQVMVSKKLSDTEKELFPGSVDNLSSGSQYSTKTLQMLKQMKIREYKAAKPPEKINEDDTDDEMKRQEKLKKYEQYCEKYKQECLAKLETVKVLKEPVTTFGERASHEMDLFKQQKDKLRKDSSEEQAQFPEDLRMQPFKEADYRNRRYNQEQPETSQQNKANISKVQDEQKTSEESLGYEKLIYERNETKRGTSGWNDYDSYRHPYNFGKYKQDFREKGRDKPGIGKPFDNTDSDDNNTGNGNKAKDSLRRGHQPIKQQTARNNADKARDSLPQEELYSRKENKQIDENSRRPEQYEYDIEGNYYSANEDSEYQIPRDVNVNKSEIIEQPKRKDLEKNVNEFKRAIDENFHNARQRQYEYDKASNYYSPNEDSQFEMLRDANVRKKEIKEKQIQKDLEKNKKNINEFERASDATGHSARREQSEYEKRGNYYLPNDDSQFLMHRKHESKEVGKNKKMAVTNLAEESLQSPERRKPQQQQISPNKVLKQNKEEEEEEEEQNEEQKGKANKPTRHSWQKKTEEDSPIKRLSRSVPTTEREQVIKNKTDDTFSPTYKKDNKNYLKETSHDEGISSSSYKNFKKVMDRNLGIYAHRSSQTENNSPTDPSDKYSQRTFQLEQDSGQTSLMPSTTEDALKYLNNFLQIYQQQTGMQQKCLKSVTVAAHNLITKLSSCKNIGLNLGLEIPESQKTVKDPNKYLEDKATSTVLQEKSTQDVIYKDPRSTPNISTAHFKQQQFEKQIETRKFEIETTDDTENFFSVESNYPEFKNPNAIKEDLISQSFDPSFDTNERFEHERYQSPDNLEYWETIETYQKYQECKDDSLNSFTQSPNFDTPYESEYYENYRDLPTSSRQPIFDPHLMPAKGILKPCRSVEQPQEEFCNFETYISATTLNSDQNTQINVQQSLSMTSTNGHERQGNFFEQLSNEDKESFIAKEKYLSPTEKQSYLELEENPTYKHPTYNDSQLEITQTLENDSAMKPPPFRQCPCMWETYLKMMQNY